MKNILFGILWVPGLILPTSVIYVAFKGYKRKNPWAVPIVAFLMWFTYVILWNDGYY